MKPATRMERPERIDWSQVWYPGPTRTFTDDELARGGLETHARSFLGPGRECQAQRGGCDGRDDAAAMDMTC